MQATPFSAAQTEFFSTKTKPLCSGNAPSADSTLFYSDSGATVYYLPGTTNWGRTYCGHPTVLWNPHIQTTAPTFGVQSNHFGFTITGTTNIPIVIDASTDLNAGPWLSLQSCFLTNGSLYFSDLDPATYPACFYRLRWPQ